MTMITSPAPLEVETAALESVTFDLYRDIHKGIRTELFGVTEAAGRVDPADGDAVGTVAARLGSLIQLLISHAEHEDEFLDPLVRTHAPDLAARINCEHETLERQMASLEVLADRAANAVATDRRTMSHRVYLGMASFTSEYLAHQAVEELQAMPALAAVMSIDEILGVHEALVGSIPPDEMARSLSLMFPAMNVDDRTKMLGGMQAGAPPEVFNGVVGLVRGLLTPDDFAAVAGRLGIT